MVLSKATETNQIEKDGFEFINVPVMKVVTEVNQFLPWNTY